MVPYVIFGLKIISEKRKGENQLTLKSAHLFYHVGEDLFCKKLVTWFTKRMLGTFKVLQALTNMLLI